ncbi:MAG: hypothetical protein LBE15_05285 [Burkholderiales bacterium]|nr:hypothetical protein [Burkholderiales bacterium]
MNHRRLFVALWPSPAVQRELAALAPDKPHGTPVRPENLHLTLALLATGTHSRA